MYDNTLFVGDLEAFIKDVEICFEARWRPVGVHHYTEDAWSIVYAALTQALERARRKTQNPVIEQSPHLGLLYFTFLKPVRYRETDAALAVTVKASSQEE